MSTPPPAPGRDSERATRLWVCGWASEGRPCRIGPDDRGGCHTTHECSPLLVDGRWLCGRPEALGGLCETGPTDTHTCSREVPSCRPVRSARGRRLHFTRWLTLGGVGLLLVLLGSTARRQLISPGPLSQGHGSLGDDCENCHQVATTSGAAWLRAAIDPGSGAPNDGRCLICHDLGTHGRDPHGLAPSVLTTVTGATEATRERSPSLLAAAEHALFAIAVPPDGRFACATCHLEHRGGDADLARMDNGRCQGCHATSFASLVDGHPEFGSWPERDAPTLNFDHRLHEGRYFPERDQTFACDDCHTPDPSGVGMPATSFERACASCHAEQIAGRGRATAPGLAVLRLPGVDLKFLRGQRRALEPWPEYADEGPTPFLELLLAADPDPTSLAELDLLDLSALDPARLQSVDRWLGRIRDVFTQLGERGHPELERRIQGALGYDLTAAQLTELCAGMPPAVLREARVRWLSGTEVGGGARRAESEVATGGWYLDDNDFSLRYRPTGHADRFLRAWTDLAFAPDPRPRAAAPLAAIRAVLTSDDAPGVCAKCHVFPTESRADVAWWTAMKDPAQHRFTRFAHGPHLRLMGDAGCASCHASVIGTTPGPDFTPTSRADCTGCHRAGRAGDRCLLCHNYHLGRISY